MSTIRRSIAASLIVLLACSSSAFGQDLRSGIGRAVTAAAAQNDAQKKSGRIPPGLLWSGIGLLAAGGVYLGVGAAEDPENETCVSGSNFDQTCVSNRTALLAAGGVMAGVGAVLLAVGVKKSHAPDLQFRPGRLTVRQPVPLDLGLRRIIGRR